MADRTKLVVTVHPSALLRIEDEDDRHAAYQDFVADLKAAAQVGKTAAKPEAKAAARKR
jgi:DNA polymerase